MARREFYTITEAARILEIPQRRLLEMIETGELEGEQDPQSSRWKIPKQAVDEIAPAYPPPESSAEGLPEEGLPEEGLPEQSTEMVLQELVDEVGNLHREIGRLRSRLDRARRAEIVERDQLLAELEQERERRRQEREQAENTLRAERERLLDEQRRERERANEIQKETNRLREELKSLRDKGSWRRLFGG